MTRKVVCNYDFALAKKEYREFCEQNEHNIQIFALPWYLDAVCDSPDDWQVIVYKENDAIVAAFPFQYKRLGKGLQSISNPWMAKRLGIWINYGNKIKPQKRESFENKIAEYVIDCLPPYDSFSIHCDERNHNWFAFYEHGFKQQTNYSYVLYADDVDETYIERLSSSQRKAIRRAKERCQIKTVTDAKGMYQFIEKSYDERKRICSYSEKAFDRLLDAVIKHDAGCIYQAIDNNDEVVGIAIIFWDSRRAYHMISTFSSLAPRGSQELLVYQAVLDAKEKGLDFDFEGSMIRGVAKFNSEFNANRNEYFLINDSSERMELYINVRRSINILKNWLFHR